MAIIYYPRKKTLVERTTDNGAYSQVVLDVYPNTVIMFDSSSHAITDVGTLAATASWAMNVVNGGSSTAATGSITVPYVTSLSSLSGTTSSIVSCANYSTANDGGGGTYYISDTLPFGLTAANELVIQSANSKYWVRINTNNAFPAEAVGCKPDNSTDNSALLGNAMLLAQKLSCSLQLGRGIYKVNSQISSTTYGAIGSSKTFANLRMNGLGMGYTVISGALASSNPIFQFSGAAEMVNCEFKNFTIKGDCRGFGFYCSGSRITLENLEVNTNRGGCIGYTNYPIHYLTIKNNWFHDILYPTSSAVDIHNQAIMVITGSARNHYTVYEGNVVENISAFGLVCKGTRYAKVRNNHIINWGVEDSSYSYGPPHAIYFSEGDEEFLCENNIIEHTASKGLYCGIHLYDHRPTWDTPSPNKIRGGIINNNTIIGSGEGIIIYGVKDIVCSNNVIKNPPAVGILGIGIGDTCENVSVCNNVIDVSTATASYGVTFGMSISSDRFQNNISIDGNNIIGAKKGAVAYGSKDWQIKNNTIGIVTGSSAGLYSIYRKSNESSNGVIDGNIFYNIGTGSNPMGGINCTTDADICITNNKFRQLRTTAVKYNSSTGVIHNNISMNGTGSMYDSSSIGSYVNNISL